MPIAVALFGLQLFFIFALNNKLVAAAAFSSWVFVEFAIWAMYYGFYVPSNIVITANKMDDSLTVSYKYLLFGREMVQVDRISNIAEIEIHPFRSCGVVSFIAYIHFKDGAKKIQIYKDNRDEDIVPDLQAMSLFLLGRDAKKHEVMHECSCQYQATFCVCCKNWGLVFLAFTLFAIVWIGGMFAIWTVKKDSRDE